MSYVVCEAASYSGDEKSLKVAIFPENKRLNVVVSSLILLYHEKSTGFLQNLFGNKPPYFVLLTQKVNELTVFSAVLYKGNDQTAAELAHDKLKECLNQLLFDGSITLNEALLKEIILPSPLDGEDLWKSIFDAMENNPATYPNWDKIFQLMLNKGVKANDKRHIRNTVRSRLSLLTKRRSTSLNLSSATPSEEGCLLTIDKLMDDGHTPLMNAARKGYLETAFYLLVGEANPNFPHPETGDTPLHFSVEAGNLDMTKLFIVYKANIHAINKNNQMPIDKVPENMVVDFKNLFEKFDSLYKISKSIYDKPVKATFPSISKDSKCLIACDGGGMRYLVVLQVLKAIEDRMMELDPSSCNPSIGSHFDYIAGTSSGSLFPVAHTYNNFALSQMLLTYLNMAQKVCTKQKSFGETISNFLLEDLVDTSLVMSDVQQPRVIITTTLAECVPPILHLLTNYGEARDGQKGPNERKVCQAMAMSASAPTHIEPFEGKFIDGGMIANNPTLDALADLILQEKKEGNNEIKLGVVVSIGTGSGPIQPINNISVCKPHSLVGTIGFVRGASNFVQLSLDQLTKTDGEHLTRAKAFCDAMGAEYFRFSPVFDKDIDLSEAKIQVLIDMLYQTYLYTLQETTKIDSLARLLLSKNN